MKRRATLALLALVPIMACQGSDRARSDQLLAEADRLVSQRHAFEDPALLDRAEQSLHAAIAAAPDSAAAHAALGEFYLYERFAGVRDNGEQRHARATPLFERALALDPDNAEALAGLAALQPMDGPDGLKRAVELYERALEREPGNALVLTDLGKCYFELKQYPQAEAVLQRAITSEQAADEEYKVREARRILGRIYTDQGRYDLAEKVLKDAIVGLAEYNQRFNTDNGCPYQALGRLYSHMGHDQSVALYLKAADTAPGTALHQYLAALKSYDGGDLQTARKYLDRALALEIRAPYRVLDGFLLLSEREDGEAERRFKKLLVGDAGLDAARVGLGHVAILRKDYPLARKHLEAAAGWDLEQKKLGLRSSELDQLVFTFKMACLGLAWVEANQQRHEQAVAALDRILKHRPDDLLTRLARGNSLLGLSRWREAAIEFGRVLQRQPDNRYALGGLATVRYNTGDDGAAEAGFKRALAEGGERYTCPYQGLGLLYLRQGKLDQAKHNLEKAIALDPGIEYRKFNGLAAILLEEGRLEEAGKLLQRSLQNAPDNAEALSLQARLRSLQAGSKP